MTFSNIIVINTCITVNMTEHNDYDYAQWGITSAVCSMDAVLGWNITLFRGT